MDPALVLSRLTQPFVTALVKRLFVTPGPGAGLVEKSAVPVRRLVGLHGEPRTVRERELHALGAKLVRQAVGGPGERPVRPDEDQVVADALARTLDALGEVGMSDVQAVALQADGFAQHLGSLAPDATRELSEEGALLHALLLEVTARHILEFFTTRSAFVPRTLVEHSGFLAELCKRYERLEARVPSQGAADAAFEERFARDTAILHNRLTIFGIDLASAPDSWPLDTTYLGLRCEPGGGPQGSATPVPVSRALAGRSRILVRGVAGSGKTTLLQWLAVATAKGELPQQLAGLRDRVPFVLPVRRFSRENPPVPGEFLAVNGYPGSDAQPPGWADRVLRQGRGLLLIDGVDEAPEPARERLRHTLRDWTALYPGNVWLVTTRPSAVPEDWLAAEEFGEVQLAPMSRDEVAAFVERWHAAARQEPGADPAVLARYEQTLIDALRLTRDLGRLATNPLMCGLLCALHRHLRGYLPSGRRELYDAAMSMLLELRDRQRVVPDDGIALSRQPKIQLLQKLAHWMLINGKSEMERDIAVDILRRHLPAVPAAARQGDAETIYRHLLNRTGLLREPTAGSVDFIHRTFQDYLAADAMVQQHDFGLLLNHSHLTEWEDVVRMAVSLSRPNEVAELLRGMVSRRPGLRTAHARHSKLLAAACLENVSEIDPEVRQLVQRATQQMVNPASPAGARALGWIGPIVLEMLPDPRTVSDDRAYILAITASSVADDMAIDYLAGLRERERMDIRVQLANAWPRYDTARYAQEVIAHLDEHGGLYFPVSDLHEARALADLGGRAHLHVKGQLDPARLAGILPVERVRRLRLEPDHPAADEQWQASFPYVEGPIWRE
ncbi:NACHT domain-containing protein [Streptomyces sp. LHD-70]|uniref:NACHT domain-containing protein n=1 Tax=Streptomyces sp. LHD-70 TaxID=3072140 RepID=UPI00280F25D4|nr:NACHT domain-containing protein [Streptomyces sp. LHD-70]MDQ8706450.1 NACHT domain-containing protein [Streptomyces sp. LHD-70]